MVRRAAKEIRTKIIGVFLSPNSENLGDKQNSWGSMHKFDLLFAGVQRQITYTVFVRAPKARANLFDILQESEL